MQQEGLAVQPTGVARQTTVATHDPMTGNQHQNRIGRHGPAHRLGAVGYAEVHREVVIGHGGPVGDELEGFPHLYLKRGSLQGQGHREGPKVALQVGFQLAEQETVGFALNLGCKWGRGLRVEAPEGQSPEASRPIKSRPHRADRGLQLVMPEVHVADDGRNRSQWGG